MTMRAPHEPHVWEFGDREPLETERPLDNEPCTSMFTLMPRATGKGVEVAPAGVLKSKLGVPVPGW